MTELYRHYLLGYNTAQCIGWSWVLQRLITAVVTQSNVYESVRTPLLIFQSLGLLEVLHALTRIVRASFQTTALQLSSRLFIVWCIIETIPETRSSLAFSLMVLAWSLTEVPRYFYFAYCSLKKPPRALVWLRYSTFFPLYPLGATSEWFCVYIALPFVKQRETLTIRMPNNFNFAFDFSMYCVFALCMYVPGLAFMYFHMIAQRRKNLGNISKESNQAKAD